MWLVIFVLLLCSGGLVRGAFFKEQDFELDNGIAVVVKVVGNGKVWPGLEDIVGIHYVRKLRSGQVLDSSYYRGHPTRFRLKNYTTKPLIEVIQKMKVGSRWLVSVPSNLAYGAKGASGIPPNSDIIYDITLVEVQGKEVLATNAYPNPFKEEL